MHEKISSWMLGYAKDYDLVVSRQELMDAFKVYDLIANDIELNLGNKNSEDYKFCYQEIQNRGYKYESEIIQQMTSLIKDLNFKRPLNQNLYSILRENLNSIPNNTHTNFFS